jgi:hypothetical protein
LFIAPGPFQGVGGYVDRPTEIGGRRDSRDPFIVSSTKDANDAMLLLHHLLIYLRKECHGLVSV